MARGASGVKTAVRFMAVPPWRTQSILLAVAGLGRLLGVDDDRELQRMVQRYADKVGGYVIEQALDGEGGLEAARARRPDLILLDVSMPRMDGRDLLKRLKADPALADIPVIMFSARSEQSDRLVGLE